jgi:hypothetical protein
MIHTMSIYGHYDEAPDARFINALQLLSLALENFAKHWHISRLLLGKYYAHFMVCDQGLHTNRFSKEFEDMGLAKVRFLRHPMYTGAAARSDGPS